jgi:hypothetical protein
VLSSLLWTRDRTQPLGNPFETRVLAGLPAIGTFDGFKLSNFPIADKPIRYRKDSAKAREEFMEHLSTLQAKQGAVQPGEDYNAAVSKIVATEIVPAAAAYRKKLEAIGETFLGNLAKSAWTAVGTMPVGAVGLTLFGALSWPHLLALAGPAAAVVGNAAIDALIASRAAARECAISYILSLES